MSFSTGRSIAVVLGTRPEMIKLSVLIALLGDQARVIHTGQHYDPTMTGEAASSVHRPHLQMRVGGQHRGVQIGAATAQLTQAWHDDPPAAVIVQGDTNAALAGALAANAVQVPLIHVEAGLRSHDRAMPEEHNRIVIDHLADLCCAVTSQNVANLWAEGIPDSRIVLTGNPIVEAVHLAERDHAAALRLTAPLGGGPYAVSTLHRPENVDDPDRLRRMLASLAALDLPVLLVIHPRTRQRVQQFGLGDLLAQLHVVDPLSYSAFLAVAEQASLLISDSGGIQEEASILGVRLLVLRRSTERPEALNADCALIPQPEQLPVFARSMAQLGKPAMGVTPFGDGRASARIADLTEMLAMSAP
ncbi:non-hydrolyzing UDP-N-acetylglucosamine 2-epimerase [Streptosporangium lutulentum]|uniref:UDP-N-acetylglucosamine 2-epimerase (Non-hydrolyzing) n=1 Tax=Streptosporangium lutulentum TaxID=1461250 RepID=A0ABT9QEL8_9ACTN|nr:UDP-N-acetylglucosamine 2-epimerase (non-hydrolyzing) [Streptosporangium lutulentum]MDP9845217.1 UDP-N-acetylglucosamine 2-epimerase (non-hydrolyzing) [Streptosporangium lutulentum]